MKFNKKIFMLIILFSLNGCMQSAGLIGPGITVATTKNAYQAGFQYGANVIIKSKTGKDTHNFILDKVETKKNKQKILDDIEDQEGQRISEDFIALVENQIKNTRKKIFQQKN